MSSYGRLNLIIKTHNYWSWGLFRRSEGYLSLLRGVQAFNEFDFSEGEGGWVNTSFSPDLPSIIANDSFNIKKHVEGNWECISDTELYSIYKQQLKWIWKFRLFFKTFNSTSTDLVTIIDKTLLWSKTVLDVAPGFLHVT